ncbi:glycosyltransferase family 4 protein [Arsenicitalea aurantiaca]|uniref:glycosyltransferase family 4 protein n=1 Tax=Arsenicitalea aurantiaca TaxID=1783274 RepID=UPI00131580CF|nr:glycosyltransferase [Arsenicitalea aurantiaca]
MQSKSSERPFSVIIFCHLLNDASGSPVVLRETIQALEGIEPDRVLFVGSQGYGALDDAGVPVRRYWYRRSRIRLLTLFAFAVSQLSLYRALSRADLPEDALIYVNTLLPFGAALWGARHGHRVVYHLHEVSISPRPLGWFLLRIAEKTAARVFYVSHDHRARLPIAGVPNQVLPNPISAKISKRGSATTYAPRRSGLFEVLMLASPRDYKGIPEFLALARGLERRPDIQFTLVLNADAAEIESYLPPARVPGNVTVHGRAATPEAFYATADLLVNLSRVDLWIETFGLTIAEAMAFGLPVIGPPVGGPSELISQGCEGYLVDSRDIATLDRSVTTLADEPSTALAMSEAARLRAREFTVSQFATALHAEILAMAPSAQKPRKR